MGKLFKADEVVRTALKIEKNGYRFYQRMAEQVDLLAVKEMFKYLAGEEKWHIETFSAILKNTADHDTPESYPGEQEEYLTALAESHVFIDDEQLVNLMENAATDVAIISLAEGFEKDSILFYMEMLELLPESERSSVRKLIHQEKNHLRKLQSLRKHFKENI